MNLTRKDDISLYLYIKDTLLGPQFSELVEGVTLTAAGNSLWDIEVFEDDICPFKRGKETGRGRGLIYFDQINDCTVVGPEQTDMIKVYDGSTVVSGYSINYVTGQIISSADLSMCEIDYYWNRVAVIDAWPYEDVPPLPLISLELNRSTSLPFQLGHGDIRQASWNIQVFATNKGERNDILDIIYSGLYLRRCSVYDMQFGLPLKQDGTFNSRFNTDLITNYSELYFEKVERKLTGLPSWGFYQTETINRYRAEITFDTRSYAK